MKPAVALLLILAALPVWADKKQPLGASLVKKPPQTTEIANLKVPKPTQSCPNWAWASALELMLEEQNVADFNQEYWVLKSAGGDLCIESPVDLDQIKQWVDGNYVLSDGTHARFKGVVTPGAPENVNHLIYLLQHGQTVLVLWKGRPCVLKAIEYDEYIYPNGQRMFEARKLTLIDPLSRSPIVFEKLKDNMSELGGVFEVQVHRGRE